VELARTEMSSSVIMNMDFINSYIFFPEEKEKQNIRQQCSVLSMGIK
jgi:hypothetical protein